MQLKEILSIEENRTMVHRDKYVGSIVSLCHFLTIPLP